MVDVGLTQVIVRRLNRYYRSRPRARGVADHYHRGVRMGYALSYRMGTCCLSLFLLAIGVGVYFLPGVFAGHSPIMVYVLKIAWLGIIVVALLSPLQALCTFAVINDEGLLKSDLWGRQTRLAWPEIARMQIKLDDNEVIFYNEANVKLTMSLCHNGWQDFLEAAAKHLDPRLFAQIAITLVGIKKRPGEEIRFPG
jgi:hypothetical protein